MKKTRKRRRFYLKGQGTENNRKMCHEIISHASSFPSTLTSPGPHACQREKVPLCVSATFTASQYTTTTQYQCKILSLNPTQTQQREEREREKERERKQRRWEEMVSYMSLVLYGVGGIVVAGMALLVAFQEKLVYVPVLPGLTKSYPITPARLRLIYEDVWLRSSDGVRLHAWFIKLLPDCRGRYV